MKKEKPPTIRVGVSGIDAAKQTTREDLAATQDVIKAIDWQHLFGLPAFQMFAVERTGKSVGEVEQWMPEFLTAEDSAIGALQLYENYCQWHTAKGYWPNEDYMGRLINDH